MKKNDFLKLNENTERRILAENRGFYDDLTTRYFGKNKAKAGVKAKAYETCGEGVRAHYSVNRTVMASVVAFVLCVTVLFAAMFVTSLFGSRVSSPSLPMPEHYFDGDEMVQNIDIDRMECAPIKITEPPASDFTYSVTRGYDRVSNDTLFYVLLVDSIELPVTISVSIYPNSRFRGIQRLENPPFKISAGGIEYGYLCSEQRSETVNGFEYIASAEIDGIVVYINYAELTLDETSDFCEYIGSIVSV